MTNRLKEIKERWKDEKENYCWNWIHRAIRDGYRNCDLCDDDCENKHPNGGDGIFSTAPEDIHCLLSLLEKTQIKKRHYLAYGIVLGFIDFSSIFTIDFDNIEKSIEAFSISENIEIFFTKGGLTREKRYSEVDKKVEFIYEGEVFICGKNYFTLEDNLG